MSEQEKAALGIMLEALREVAIALDDWSDVVDGDEESGPLPGRAMQLLTLVDDAIAKGERAYEG